MPGQHATKTVSVRIPGADRTALKEVAERKGITPHAAILRAISEYLARQETSIMSKTAAQVRELIPPEGARGIIGRIRDGRIGYVHLGEAGSPLASNLAGWSVRDDSGVRVLVDPDGGAYDWRQHESGTDSDGNRAAHGWVTPRP